MLTKLHRISIPQNIRKIRKLSISLSLSLFTLLFLIPDYHPHPGQSRYPHRFDPFEIYPGGWNQLEKETYSMKRSAYYIDYGVRRKGKNQMG
jgi:hypothetical protein